MAPSANDIKSLLESAVQSQLTKPKEALASQSLYDFGNLVDHFSDEVHFRIAGHPHEFALAQDVKGLHDFKELLNTVSHKTLGSLIDMNKPITSEVVRVIGGGDSEWAAAILRDSATSVKNKPIKYELVVILQFNDLGKISEIQVYVDTLHIQTHISDVY